MKDPTQPKIAGTIPGELIRDLADPRLLTAHPRADGVDDGMYVAQLLARGLVFHLSREQLVAGEYARAKAEAMLFGAPVLVPYDEFDRPNDAASESFDYVRWRADYDRAEREGGSLYDGERAQS